MTGKKQELWKATTADPTAEREAAEHLLRAYEAGIDPDCDHEIVAWCRKSDANETAFRELAPVWKQAANLKNHPAYAELLGTPTLREHGVALLDGARRQMAARVRSPGVAFASLALATIVGGAWFLEPVTPEYATRIAEIREVPLNDGSTVTLGGRSALGVAFTPSERMVRLEGGEALFSVAHNRGRPFIVLAGDTRIRAVGTRFNVRNEDGSIRVSVLEGVVEVTHKGSEGARAVRLLAGQQLATTGAASPGVPQALESTRPDAWREGYFNYQDAPLSEVIADANRYHKGEIRITSPKLGQERLTVSFRTSQIDQMLDALPRALPLVLTRYADGSIELHLRTNN